MILILASKSPRRRQLLTLGGWQFSVLPAEIDESVLLGESPEDYVLRMSVVKAEATRSLLKQDTDAEALIIAADTAVVFLKEKPKKASADQTDGSLESLAEGEHEIIGKPIDAVEAEAILHRLRGRTHQVYSAVTVLRTMDAFLKSDVCVTDVPMRHYSDEEMKDYIATGDPLDKAGAYAIQSEAFHPVQNLQDCYVNVMGLPLCHLTRILRAFNVIPTVDIAEACQESTGYDCPIYLSVLGCG